MDLFFPRGRKARVFRRIVFISSLVGALCGACTRAELESKAEAYNAAIATSTNELILLNAVRASQRAPMSFTGLGDVTATPAVSGSVSGTANFDPFGLTTWLVNPSVAVNGGFSQYSMSNLNSTEFMRKIRDEVPYKLVAYFRAHKWPQELVGIMFIRSYETRLEAYYRLLREARARCDTATDPRMRSICDLLDEDIARTADCPPHVEQTGVVTLLNTGRELCSALKFQIFLRSIVWVLHLDPFEPQRFSGRLNLRSAMDMLYYLGELIAAQNYSTRSYMPSTYVGGADIVRRAPLFVVRRGVPLPGTAAVRVLYNGDVFYIPQPELGTFEEAHSMQVLDFATQVITAQTTSKDLPKATVLPVLSVR
jgi:hypothetical protein